MGLCLKIISLRDAERANLKHYFTGKACPRGHVGPRYVCSSHCVKCTVERVLEWQNKNPEKKKAKQARYDARLSKEQKLEASRRDKVTARQKREIRLVEIAGRPRPTTCDICKAKNARRKDIIAFDHCHKTGKFRGWLCDRCNLVLGAAEDNPKLLREMAKYLDRTAQKNRTPLDIHGGTGVLDLRTIEPGRKPARDLS